MLGVVCNRWLWLRRGRLCSREDWKTVVQFFVDSEAGFLGNAFKLADFGFKGTESGGEPRGRA